MKQRYGCMKCLDGTKFMATIEGYAGYRCVHFGRSYERVVC